jgi:sterol 3beta-glucosyltransferase
VVPRPADWRDNVRLAGYWWPPRPHDWQPSDELQRFLADGPAPVYVGFGSVGVGKAGSLGPVVLDALDRTGMRAVVQRGWADLDVAGDNILTISEVPHDWLFPRVAVAVHHAGAGTTAAAQRAGIASVPVPFVWDQAFWARRLVTLGTAPCSLPAQRLSGQRLATTTTRSSNDPRYSQAATAIAHDIAREDGAATRPGRHRPPRRRLTFRRFGTASPARVGRRSSRPSAGSRSMLCSIAASGCSRSPAA